MNRTRDISLLTLQDIEDAIKAANSGILQRISIDEINKRHGAIRDASRLQALVTMARKSEDKTLHLYGSNNLENVLEGLCSYAPALTAIRLNKEISLGLNRSSRRRSLIYAKNKIINTDMQKYSEVIKGRTIDLCCISGAERQYLSPLFTTREHSAVKSAPAMSQSLTEIFKEIGKGDFNNLDGDLIRDFGFFTCELFKNTQEHARTDVNGSPLPGHVEGIIASFINLEANMFEEDFSSHPRLREYLISRADESPGVDKLRCIQISFFDTGPGITGRAFGNKYYEGDRGEEKTALLSCLKKNFTSKNQTGAGNGYLTILTQLKKIGGLIRIRTGRHCIFNCFEKDNDSQVKNNIRIDDDELMNFDDWTSDNLGLAAGTVVSILVPLRNESGQSSLF